MDTTREDHVLEESAVSRENYKCSRFLLTQKQKREEKNCFFKELQLYIEILMNDADILSSIVCGTTARSAVPIRSDRRVPERNRGAAIPDAVFNNAARFLDARSWRGALHTGRSLNISLGKMLSDGSEDLDRILLVGT
ncbi:MAG: hypothetical protein AB7P69_12130, partial [Candidatus Binatia bacterium]